MCSEPLLGLPPRHLTGTLRALPVGNRRLACSPARTRFANDTVGTGLTIAVQRKPYN